MYTKPEITNNFNAVRAIHGSTGKELPPGEGGIQPTNNAAYEADE